MFFKSKSPKRHCPDCGYLHTADALTSFGGKFCPRCGERLIEALAAEKSLATAALDQLAQKFTELATEPTSKNLGFKITLVMVCLGILQIIGYSVYTVVRPFFVDPQTLALESELGDPEVLKLFDQAQAATNANDTTRASEIYQQILALQPDSTRALLGLGFISSLSDDADQARLYYEQVLELDPANATAHQNIGVQDKKTENWDSAISHLQAAVISEPENTTALLLLAEAYDQGKQDFVSAVEQLETALAVNPKLKRAHLALIEIYKKTGNTTGLAAAIAEAKSALPADPEIQNQ